MRPHSDLRCNISRSCRIKRQGSLTQVSVLFYPCNSLFINPALIEIRLENSAEYCFFSCLSNSSFFYVIWAKFGDNYLLYRSQPCPLLIFIRFPGPLEEKHSHSITDRSPYLAVGVNFFHLLLTGTFRPPKTSMPRTAKLHVNSVVGAVRDSTLLCVLLLR